MELSSFDEACLQHYGVKGMQWGVRRTRAQLARARQERAERKDPSTPEGAVLNARQKAAKNRRLLSDQEVNELITRLEKEKKLKTLVEEDVSPGKSFAKSVLSDSGKATARKAATGAAAVAAGAAAALLCGDRVGAAVARGKVK